MQSRAIDWDNLYDNGRDYRPMNLFLLEKVIKAANPRGRDALDLGCGTGDLMQKLAAEGYKVAGIDGSRVALNLAKKKLAGSEAHLINTDLESDSWQVGGKFDLIFCKLVFAFINEKQKLLERLKPLLKGSGSLVIITPVLYSGYEYNDRLKSISLEFEELDQILKRNFREVSILHEDYFENLGSELTIVCKQPI